MHGFFADAATHIAVLASTVGSTVSLDGFNWNQFLAFLGFGLLGLGLSGSAIGLSIAGCAVTGVKPEKRNLALIVSVLPGTQGIYSFAVGMIAMTKLSVAHPDKWYLTIFAAGLLTGLACLFSGWWQGVVCAAGIKSINQDKMGVGQAMLLGVFPELYAIFSLAFSALLLFRHIK